MVAETPLGIPYEIGQPPQADQPALILCGKSQKHLQRTQESLSNTEQVIVNRLKRWQMQTEVRHILPDERVAKCRRQVGKVFSRPGAVQVVQSLKTGNVHYGNLMVCGSIWNCPVCAVMISEGRVLEIGKGIDVWNSRGGTCDMMTQTFPHSRFDVLQDVLKLVSEANKLFKNRKTFKRVLNDCAGIIRSLEVTFGVNGWHPHLHNLLFLERPLSEDASMELLIAWQDSCVAVGLPRPNAHGLQLDRTWSSADYMAKYGHEQHWGAGQELAKTHSKSGREGSLTPFDFLRRALNSRGPEKKYYHELFRTYAKAFKGRRQLLWSPGLKKLLGVREITDQELAESKEEPSVLLGLLSREDWRLILCAEKRGELLEAVRVGGWSAVEKFMSVLTGKGLNYV